MHVITITLPLVIPDWLKTRQWHSLMIIILMFVTTFVLHWRIWTLIIPQAILQEEMQQIESHLKFIQKHQVINLLNRSNGKAPENSIDSLGIYIKLVKSYQLAQKKGHKTPIKPTILVQFFTIIANRPVRPKIKEMLHTTYIVDLQKSESEPRKLWPLGIPSAHIYRSRFVNHILPFNYAFGINGGVDFVASSVRLGVKKYIQDETDTKLPSQCLVSLDIKNKLIDVSHQKLPQIIATILNSLNW